MGRRIRLPSTIILEFSRRDRNITPQDGEINGVINDKIIELDADVLSWLRDIMTCLSEEEQKQFENYCERLLAAAKKLTDNGGNDQ